MWQFKIKHLLVFKLSVSNLKGVARIETIHGNYLVGVLGFSFKERDKYLEIVCY